MATLFTRNISYKDSKDPSLSKIVSPEAVKGFDLAVNTIDCLYI